MRRGLLAWVLGLLLLPAMAYQAAARVDINVNLSTQRMTVLVNGKHYATWRISSGRRGYYTPRGTWRPKFLKRMHYSRKYNNAPMPYSIFYYGGYAIHGTNVISRLGRPASHGCIRLHPSNAARLFELVKRHGRRNVRIRVFGSTDVAYARLAKERKRRVVQRKRIRKLRRDRRKLRRVRAERRYRRSAQVQHQQQQRLAMGDPFEEFFRIYEAVR